MEENNNGEILIDVKLDDLIASLQELKKQYDANTEAMKALKKAGQDDSDAYRKLIKDNKELKFEMSGVERQIQTEIKLNKSREGSLNHLRAEIAKMIKQYDAMSAAERMSASGTALQQKIQAMSNEVMGLEANTNRWQRNVGNYQSALQGLSTSFKAAGLATGGLDKSLRLLNANPIMLFLTALIGVVRAVTQAMKGNEESSMELKEAYAALNPATDALKRSMQDLGDAITRGAKKSVDAMTGSISALLHQLDEMGRFFGADWHMGDNFDAGSEAARRLQERENDYIVNKRRWSVESAKIDRQVADLREKAAQRDKYSAEERLAYLDKAIALETRKASMEKKFAEENLRNLQAEAKRTKNDSEMMDRLAEAERAVIAADTALSNTKRSLARQRQAAIAEIDNETTRTKTYTGTVKELREELEEIRMMSLGEAAKEAAKGNKELADALTEAANAAGVLNTELSELQGLETHIDVDVEESVGDAPSKLDQLAAAFQRNSETIVTTANAMGDSFASLSSIYKTMAEDESKSEEERAEAARKAQMWAKLQIAANSGTAIAKGVASAMDQPFPANLAAIATTLAAVLSAIAQAKALAAEGGSEGHAGGGPVGNTFTGATMGPDNTYIRARRGEMVINAEQQRQLYELANGNGSTSLAASLAAALRAMPAPVLDYREFTAFETRVAAINESSSIR